MKMIQKETAHGGGPRAVSETVERGIRDQQRDLLTHIFSFIIIILSKTIFFAIILHDSLIFSLNQKVNLKKKIPINI